MALVTITERQGDLVARKLMLMEARLRAVEAKLGLIANEEKKTISAKGEFAREIADARVTATFARELAEAGNTATFSREIADATITALFSREIADATITALFSREVADAKVTGIFSREI